MNKNNREKKIDPPVVTGFRRLSWLLGLAAGLICFITTAPYYYMGEAAVWSFFAAGAAFGFSRILVLVVRAFRVGKDTEKKVITGFKRLSWLAAVSAASIAGITVGIYEASGPGILAGIVAAIIVFPIFRFLLLWIVRGFAESR